MVAPPPPPLSSSSPCFFSSSPLRRFLGFYLFSFFLLLFSFLFVGFHGLFCCFLTSSSLFFTCFLSRIPIFSILFFFLSFSLALLIFYFNLGLFAFYSLCFHPLSFSFLSCLLTSIPLVFSCFLTSFPFVLDFSFALPSFILCSCFLIALRFFAPPRPPPPFQLCNPRRRPWARRGVVGVTWRLSRRASVCGDVPYPLRGVEGISGCWVDGNSTRAVSLYSFHSGMQLACLDSMVSRNSMGALHYAAPWKQRSASTGTKSCRPPPPSPRPPLPSFIMFRGP